MYQWVLGRRVELCCELEFQQVTFEGDSLIIVFVLNRKDPCWSSYGHIIEDTSSYKSQAAILFFYATSFINDIHNFLKKKKRN
jgi:hypothetical protein